MTIATRPAAPSRPAVRRIGYLIAILVNAAMLWAVVQLWDEVPFLTGDFARLLPLIGWSLGASIAVNAVYLSYDPAWFRSFTQIGLNGIALAVTLRMYQVFPFDFSAYGFDWSGPVRLLLILSMAAVAMAVLVEAVRLVRRALDRASAGVDHR